MDAEPLNGGSDLVTIRHGRGGPLCISGVDPMPPLVLPLSLYLSGDRCTSTPLAGHESVCFPSGQAHPSGIVQGEDIRSPPSGLPRHGSQSWTPFWRAIRGRFQSGKTCCVSFRAEFGTYVQRSGSCGYGDHRSPLAFDLSDGVRDSVGGNALQVMQVT